MPLKYKLKVIAFLFLLILNYLLVCPIKNLLFRLHNWSKLINVNFHSDELYKYIVDMYIFMNENHDRFIGSHYNPLTSTKVTVILKYILFIYELDF